MNVQEVKRQIRLTEWAAQIEDRKQSGLTVKQWREENGIHKKTYYNRMKRVREELKETPETSKSLHLTAQSSCGGSLMPRLPETPTHTSAHSNGRCP